MSAAWVPTVQVGTVTEETHGAMAGKWPRALSHADSSYDTAQCLTCVCVFACTYAQGTWGMAIYEMLAGSCLTSVAGTCLSSVAGARE